MEVGKSMAGRKVGGAKGGRAGIELARQAFLYGRGDGKPVSDVGTLTKIGDIAAQTVYRHRPKWLATREAMAKADARCPLGLSIDERTLVAHAADVDFLRDLGDEIKEELSDLGNVKGQLFELLNLLAEMHEYGPEDVRDVVELLKGYFRTTSCRQKLSAEFLSIQKRWQDSAGIAANLAAYAEVQKGKARAATGQDRPRPATNRREAGRGVFTKAAPVDIAAK